MLPDQTPAAGSERQTNRGLAPSGLRT
jgi:hypothetical protein